MVGKTAVVHLIGTTGGIDCGEEFIRKQRQRLEQQQKESQHLSILNDGFRVISDFNDKKLNNNNNINNFQYDNKINNENMNNNNNEYNDNCDILTNLIGDYGRFQFIWTLFLCMFQFPSTFHVFSFVFTAANKDFWCARPEHLKSLSVDIWRNLTQPDVACAILKHNYYEYNVDNIANRFHYDSRNISSIKCSSFEFDNTLIGRTIIEEWGLICDREYMVTNVELCFLAGAAIGSICSGFVSDQFGRKHTLMAFATAQTILGIFMAFANTLEVFMTIRVLLGIASMSVLVVSFVLVVELVSGTTRTVIGILSILPVAIAYIIMAGIVYVARDWRTIQLTISLPSILFLLAWHKLPESPRWLLTKGRIDELQNVIERASTMNNITLPNNYEKALQQSIDDKTTSSNTVVTIFDLFNSNYRRTTLLMIVVWFSLILIYFGITLHLNKFGGNIYVTTAVAGLIEAISICISILIVLKLGIRTNLILYMTISGIACLLINAVPQSSSYLWAGITLAIIAKCTIGANNAIIPTFTAYQYPTSLRSLGVGVGNFAAGFALIIVPYIWLLEEINFYLPMTIMGTFGIIGAIGLILLKNQNNIDNTIINNNDKKNTSDDNNKNTSEEQYYSKNGMTNHGFINDVDNKNNIK